MLGTPGSPHGLITGRHCSRAVTCPPAAPSQHLRQPGGVLGEVGECHQRLHRLRQRRAHGGREAGHPDGVEQRLQLARQRDGGGVHRGAEFAGSPGTAAIRVVEVGPAGADVGVELVLGMLGDGLGAAVGRVGDLPGETGLRVVERGAHPLRLGEQLGDRFEGVRHERRGLVEAGRRRAAPAG